MCLYNRYFIITAKYRYFLIFKKTFAAMGDTPMEAFNALIRKIPADIKVKSMYTEYSHPKNQVYDRENLINHGTFSYEQIEAQTNRW